MAVPTKHEFEEFAQESWRPWLEIFWESPVSDIGKSYEQIGEDLIASELDRVYRLKMELSASIDDHPVIKWIDGNPTSGRVWASLYGRRIANHNNSYDAHAHARRLMDSAMRSRKFSDYEWMRGRFSGITTDADIQQKVDEANTDDARARRIHDALRRVFMWDPLDVYRSIALPLMGYFHENSHRKHTVNTTERQKAAKAILVSISQLSDDELWLRAGVDSARMRGLSRAIKELEIAAVSKSNAAIKKCDETAPERALAFELWSEFRRKFRANKITSIYNVLQFEGIANPPDPRSIERWVKDWKSRKVELAPSDRRHEARTL